MIKVNRKEKCGRKRTTTVREKNKFYNRNTSQKFQRNTLEFLSTISPSDFTYRRWKKDETLKIK